LIVNTSDVNKVTSLLWTVTFTSRHIHFTSSVSTWWNLYMRSATFIHEWCKCMFHSAHYGQTRSTFCSDKPVAHK